MYVSYLLDAWRSSIHEDEYAYIAEIVLLWA